MKHEIEIEGLPEGWRAVAFRVPKEGEYFITPSGLLMLAEDGSIIDGRLIVQKTKPRRIVLEETEEDNKHLLNSPMYANQWVNLDILLVNQPKIWRVVKEGKRSSTTFRERVINDLVHNRIISDGE